MISVIIVDDEPFIRNGIKAMIDWEQYQMQVAATFSNGALALEYMRDHPAELIITDIKMPFMDGIQLMQACKEHDYNTRFIILSGYSDFEYVKAAAQLGIENYLLKPIDKDELCKTLLQVKDKIEAYRQKTILVDEGLCILRNNILYRIITGTITYDEIMDKKEFLSLSLHENDYRAAIIRFFSKDCGRPVNIQTEYSAFGRILNRLEQQPNIYSVTDINGEMLYLLLDDCRDKSNTLTHELQAILSYINATTDFHGYISVGLPVKVLDAMSESFQSALSLAKNSRYNNHEFIQWADTPHVSQSYNLPHIDFDALMQLKDKLSYRDKNALLLIIDEIFEKNRFIDCNGLVFLASIITEKIYNTMYEYHTVSNPDFRKLKSELNTVHALSDYSSIVLWVHNMVTKIFDCQSAVPRNSTSGIKAVIDYLDKNYSDNINLKILADMFHTNPLYLGRLLKQKTGYNFTDYLNHLRIQKACDYLTHTDYSAKEIAEKTGYNNDKYFNTLFKKNTGLTPIEYRKIHKEDSL